MRDMLGTVLKGWGMFGTCKVIKVAYRNRQGHTRCKVYG